MDIEDKAFYIMGIVVGVILILIGVLTYTTKFNLGDIVPPCNLRTLTGFYCPGCGGTRAVLALIHGHPIRSFLYHPIVLIVFVFGVIFMVRNTIWIISRGKLNVAMKFREKYIFICIGIFLINWIVQNIIIFINKF